MAAVEEDGSAVPGTWIAKEIRRFQENSEGLFPTPKLGDSRTRFNTIYNIEYLPFQKDLNKQELPTALKRHGIKKEHPFNLEQAKRFHTWKIRKDLVEVDKVQQKVAERRKTAYEASTRLPEANTAVTQDRVHTVGHDASHVKRKSHGIKTPILPPGPQSSSVVPSSSRRDHNRMTAPAGVQRDNGSRLGNIKRDLLVAAEDYMTKAPQTDRRVIDKALEGSNRTFKEDNKQLVTKLPSPRKEAEKWLEQANELEQELAVRFFKSVSGMRLMGLGGRREQAQRLQELVHSLENGEAKVPMPRINYEQEHKIRARKQRNLQFVRLLSPQSGDTRFERQSWHHLPEYKAMTKSDNVRSHFTQPQKVKPLHFTIHPDWGP